MNELLIFTTFFSAKSFENKPSEEHFFFLFKMEIVSEKGLFDDHLFKLQSRSINRKFKKSYENSFNIAPAIPSIE